MGLVLGLLGNVLLVLCRSWLVLGRFLVVLCMSWAFRGSLVLSGSTLVVLCYAWVCVNLVLALLGSFLGVLCLALWMGCMKVSPVLSSISFSSLVMLILVIMCIWYWSILLGAVGLVVLFSLCTSLLMDQSRFL